MSAQELNCAETVTRSNSFDMATEDFTLEDVNEIYEASQSVENPFLDDGDSDLDIPISDEEIQHLDSVLPNPESWDDSDDSTQSPPTSTDLLSDTQGAQMPMDFSDNVQVDFNTPEPDSYVVSNDSKIGSLEDLQTDAKVSKTFQIPRLSELYIPYRESKKTGDTEYMVSQEVIHILKMDRVEKIVTKIQAQLSEEKLNFKNPNHMRIVALSLYEGGMSSCSEWEIGDVMTILLNGTYETTRNKHAWMNQVSHYSRD